MKKLQLILTNPCTQQWSDIERADGKHYCNKCEKNIVDLTTKSDQQLLNFFKHKTGNVCGRLLESQMNRNLMLSPSKPGFHWLIPLALTSLVISPALAQKPAPAVIQNEGPNKNPSQPLESSNTLPALRLTLKGTVLDQNGGKALMGVKIKRFGDENILAITDSLGRFELNLSDNDRLSKFTFNLPGYSSFEAYLNDGMVIKLNAKRTIMLGGISMVSLDRTPLYLVHAGNKSCIIPLSRFTELSPDWIEKIEILKDTQATAVYGSKGANGVIMIEIKKAYRKKFKFSK